MSFHGGQKSNPAHVKSQKLAVLSLQMTQFDSAALCNASPNRCVFCTLLLGGHEQG